MLLVALVSGCYASVGPTIGYTFPNGFTYGVEADGAAVGLVQTNFGVLLRNADDPADHSAVATGYGTLGLGIYKPPEWGGSGYVVAAGLGGAGDREKDRSFMASIWGGPALDFSNRGPRDEVFFQLNVFLGIKIWNDKAMLYLTPQAGVGWVPYMNMD